MCIKISTYILYVILPWKALSYLLMALCCYTVYLLTFCENTQKYFVNRSQVDQSERSCDHFISRSLELNFIFLSTYKMLNLYCVVNLCVYIHYLSFNLSFMFFQKYFIYLVFYIFYLYSWLHSIILTLTQNTLKTFRN